jgi:predicted transcriptional regulator
MKERRSKLQILADILEALAQSGEMNISQLLTAANLSYDRLSKYLSELEANNLVVVERQSLEVKIKPTSKGLSFLQEYKKIKEIAVAFGISL